jgi:hypothetical protein
MRGRTTFEAVSAGQTRMTSLVEIPGMDEKMDKVFLQGRLERSSQTIKRMIESEA